MNGFTCNVEEATFDERVIARSHAVPVVLDIGAEWCSPCQVLTPLLEKLELAYDGKFSLAKVDADENMRIAGRLQAKGFPTVIAYSRGKSLIVFTARRPSDFCVNFWTGSFKSTMLLQPSTRKHWRPLQNPRYELA